MDSRRSMPPARRKATAGAMCLIAAVAAGATVACPAAAAGLAAASRPAVSAARGPYWLAIINSYRRGAGIRPVTANPAWVRGISNHLRYMARTPARYLTGKYASLHTENPRSPYYTRSGAREAARSDLFEGAVGYTAANFINGWLAAPFHAIGMLRVDLRQVAFASNKSTGDAGLDVLGGLTGRAPLKLVRFPGPGMTTGLRSFSGEEPNPLQTCRWRTGRQYGLPLIALLPAEPRPHLTARLRSSAGPVESTGGGSLCMLDEHHYRSTDPIYGPTGREILVGDHAVILIPRLPLRSATYRVSIRQPGLRSISWSFSVR